MNSSAVPCSTCTETCLGHDLIEPGDVFKSVSGNTWVVQSIHDTDIGLYAWVYPQEKPSDIYYWHTDLLRMMKRISSLPVRTNYWGDPMIIDLSRPYGLRTFDIGEGGSETNTTSHRGNLHELLQGEYCYAGDALEYIERAECAERDQKMAITELCTAIDCLYTVIGLTPIAGNKETLQEAMDFARAVQLKHQTCSSDAVQTASARLMRELAKPNNGL